MYFLWMPSNQIICCKVTESFASFQQRKQHSMGNYVSRRFYWLWTSLGDFGEGSMEEWFWFWLDVGRVGKIVWTDTFFFFFFSGGPMVYGVPGPGIRSEMHLQPMLQLWQCWVLNCAGPGIESLSQWSHHSGNSWTDILIILSIGQEKQ